MPRWRAFPPRQITGAPFFYYGYVGEDAQHLRHCHETPNRWGSFGIHRGARAAAQCAERAARRLNRSAA